MFCVVPDFRGEWIESFVDGSKMRYFPSDIRRAYIQQSIVVVGSLILLVVGIVVSIYIMRFAITSKVGASNAQTVASVCNAVQIQVLNLVYTSIAQALTERENHRFVFVL